MKDFKVKCISRGCGSNEYFTIGKVYEFKDGNVRCNTGSSYFCNDGRKCAAKTVDELNDHFIKHGYGQKFELVEEEKMFTKYDLKTGMRVQKRNGDKYLVLLNTPEGDILISESGWTSLKNIRADFTSTYGREYDIVRAFKPTQECQMIVKRWSEMQLIWERKEEQNETTIKELTIEEIAKKFGVEADSIRIKE
ncbi:MAG: hypothetical protein LLG05_18855 [Porphyromonadaceae bacterium]|nr:hypothetical protein [Porphyromonadaceae bacterium]